LKRGANPDFVAQQGNPLGVTRGADGKLTSSRSEAGRKVALRLLERPAYVRSLYRRLLQGVAGTMEVHLHRMAYGDPPKADTERDQDQERFLAMREAVLAFLKDSPEQAKALNAVVTRAPRLLSLPPRPAQPDDSDGDEQD